MSTVQGSLAVMRNAFSTASVGPKIPDGAVSFSLTERLAIADSQQSPSGTLTIILTPSLLEHYQSSESVNALGTEALSFAPVVTEIHDDDADPLASKNIDRYRLVSGAMRLNCINGSETMNGWFEAIRVNCEYNIEDFVASTGIFKAGTFEDNIASSKNWASSPSYVTGRLRDIGKHTFCLKNINNHEFHPTNATALDKNYDVILVRIHSIASDVAAQQTSVHIHVVKNWELVYDAKSPLSRYHTSCPVWKAGVDNVKKAMARDPKASMIRAASAYAYR